MLPNNGSKNSKNASGPKRSPLSSFHDKNLQRPGKDTLKNFLSPENIATASHDDAKSQGSLAQQSELKSTQAFTYSSISNNVLNEKKTLVLDLDETLVHASIEQKSKQYMPLNVLIEGNYCLVYVIKRPGLIDFLSELCNSYNILIYTSADRTFVETICEAVGISPYIIGIHARERFTKAKGERALKNIIDIGLVPSRTVLVDDSSKHVVNQPDNAIRIKPFQGDNRDRELYYLLPFLKHITNLPEIRPVVTHLFDYFESDRIKNKENDLLNYNRKIYNDINSEGTAEDCKPNKTQYISSLYSLQSLKSKMADSLSLMASSNLIQSYPKKPLLIGKDLFNTDPSVYEYTDNNNNNNNNPKMTTNSLQIWKNKQENDQKMSFNNNARILNMLQSSGDFLLSKENL